MLSIDLRPRPAPPLDLRRLGVVRWLLLGLPVAHLVRPSAPVTLPLHILILTRIALVFETALKPSSAPGAVRYGSELVLLLHPTQADP